MILALSIFTGMLVAVMIQLNGILQATAGSLNSLMLIHIFGLGASGLLFVIFRRRMLGDKSQPVPRVFLGAGAIGTIIVFLASVSFGKGGILLSLSGSLAGQTLVASVIEGFYRGGRKRSPVFQRILSPALLLPGSVIIGLKVGASPLWIMISWIPGIFLMIQQSMNARNTAHYGTPLTVVFNYLSALVVIIPMAVFISGSFHIGKSGFVLTVLSELQLPWYVIAGGGLIGVFTTGSIAFMLLKSPALPVILGIYSGELSAGILLDLYNGNAVAVEKIIGIILIAAGLAAGKIRLANPAQDL